MLNSQKAIKVELRVKIITISMHLLLVLLNPCHKMDLFLPTDTEIKTQRSELICKQLKRLRPVPRAPEQLFPVPPSWFLTVNRPHCGVFVAVGREADLPLVSKNKEGFL